MTYRDNGVSNAAQTLGTGGEDPPLPPALASMTLLAAAVVVHDRNTGRVLLLQRGPQAKFGRGGQWDLPVGKCDPGESVTAAAVRELAEETGLQVAPTQLRLGRVVHGALGAEAPTGFVTVVFVAEEWSGRAFNREPGKHAAVAWLPVDDLPEPLVFDTDHTIANALAGPAAVATIGWS